MSIASNRPVTASAGSRSGRRRHAASPRRSGPVRGQREGSTFHGRIRRACPVRATVSLPIPYRAVIDLVAGRQSRPRRAEQGGQPDAPTAAVSSRRTRYASDGQTPAWTRIRRVVSAFETPSAVHDRRPGLVQRVCQLAPVITEARWGLHSHHDRSPAGLLMVAIRSGCRVLLPRCPARPCVRPRQSRAVRRTGGQAG